MKTTEIYLVRHAHKAYKLKSCDVCDIVELNKKRPLSPTGQQQAKMLSELPCFADADVIFSSDYSRAIETAVYLAEKRNCAINIYPGFGERIRTNDMFLQMPKDYRNKQFIDEKYKIHGGESREDVFKRFHKGIDMILHQYAGKKIIIFSHKTSITMLLMHWCKWTIEDELCLSYNGNTIFSGKWDGSPEIFRLVFDDSLVRLVEKIDNHCKVSDISP